MKNRKINFGKNNLYYSKYSDSNNFEIKENGCSKILARSRNLHLYVYSDISEQFLNDIIEKFGSKFFIEKIGA